MDTPTTTLTSMPLVPEKFPSIDEVIAELGTIINDSINTNSRAGYFAALYQKVTIRVKEGIANGEFDDNARMEKFDVIFAMRYLEAIKQWKNGTRPTAPWQVAFDTTNRTFPLVLQHLLLGMNAHINLDLGIAAVGLSRQLNQDIQLLRKDFMSINAILGALTLEVSNQINRVSPLLSLFGLHATNTSLLIQFSLSNARDGSWNFAEELSEKAGDDFDQCIQTRADTIKKLGSAIINTSGLIRITMLVIYIFEWKIPRKIIKVLHGSSKRKYVQINPPT